MNELRRSAQGLIEELHKTDAVKATDCSSHVERLQVLLSPVDTDATFFIVFHRRFIYIFYKYIVLS